MPNLNIIETTSNPQFCIIWMHGLGSNGQDMKSLVQQIQTPISCRHVFLDAPVRPVTINQHIPMRAWYDIKAMGGTIQEDRDGILQSENIIKQAIEEQAKEGFTYSQIFLAGFSQGGAMALHTGLHTSKLLGGIIVLSGYLPLINEFSSSTDKRVPIFFATGEFDEVVLPVWSKFSVTYLREKGFNQIEEHQYPMGHSVSIEEIRDLTQWLIKRIKTNSVKDQLNDNC